MEKTDTMKKSIALLLIALALCTSCDKFLDRQSKTQVDGKEMFETEQGFKDALIACYVKMKSDQLYGLHLTMTTLELMAQHWDPDPLNLPNQIAMKKLDYGTMYARDLFNSTYGELYNVVAQANDVLENLDRHGDAISSPRTRGVIRAEALAVRAFVLSDVLRLFGQMPVNSSTKVRLAYPEHITREELPFYDFDEFVRRLLADLNAAEELFKEYDPLNDKTLLEMDASNADTDSFLTFRRFRMNLYAVQGLKARLNLYLGNRAEAYTLAKGVIDATTSTGSRVVTLSGDTDLTKNWYAFPTECIFALNKTDIEPRISSVSSYRLTRTHYEDLFGQNLSSDSRALLVWDRTTTDASNTNYPTLRKYKAPGAEENIRESELLTRRQVVPLIRLPEMYLIAMETTTSIAEANQLYKDFMRARRIVIGADLTRDQLDAEIEKEYRRELYAEGQMFYYYKRHNTKKMMWGAGGELTETNYIVPLPETELQPKQ